MQTYFQWGPEQKELKSAQNTEEEKQGKKFWEKREKAPKEIN